MIRKIALASALAFAFATPAMACPMADAAAYSVAAEAVQASAGTKATFKVEGMTCGSCSTKVSDALKAIDGVEAVAVDYQTGETQIAYDSAKTDADKLLAAIKATGYAAQTNS